MTHAIFICEVCGGVFDQTCPTCPDRGGGRGFTVGEIMDHLRACKTVADVNACATNFGSHVRALLAPGHGVEGAKTMAIQIKNLAKYRRWFIGETWRKK